MKECSRCKVTKNYSEFNKATRNKDGHQRYCRACNSAYFRETAKRRVRKPTSKEDARRYGLKHYYGLTQEQFDDMLLRQNNQCLICCEELGDGRRRHIDHSHECCPGQRSCGECIRGILCYRCNHLVGVLETNSEILEIAIRYASVLR